MKRITKRVISMVAVLALSVALAVPVLAADEIHPITSSQEVYLTSKLIGTTSSVNISLADGTKDFLIRRSEVKVTPGKTGAKMTGFSKNYKSYNNTRSTRSSSSKEWQTSTSQGTNCHYTAELVIKSAGTAKVEYKLGNKIYASTVKVLAYENPVKSITMTGVNDDKNFASLTKSSAVASNKLTIKSGVKNPMVDIIPQTGWRITNVNLSGDKDGTSLSLSNTKQGLSSAILCCGRSLSTKKTYHLNVTFRNTSNKATINVSYTIG